MTNTRVKRSPIASIVIPCFNREDWIERAIVSSLNQTYRDLEVIVVDDGSSDDSVLAIKSFGSQIRLICQQNEGSASARNRGLKAANGEFVLFLDSDDFIESNSMESLVKFSESSDLVFGPFAFERDGQIYYRSCPLNTDDSLIFSDSWVSGRFVPTCSVLWRRSFIESIGGWRISALRNDDGEIVMRAMIRGARFSFADAGLGLYCHHNTPGRVSRRAGRDILFNQLDMFEALFKLAVSQKFSEFGPVIGRAFYSIATEAFLHDADDIGEHALYRARNLGFRGHPGSWRHRASARVLGLRRKLKLARLIRGVPTAAVSACRGRIAG